jgi:hypothetical protein
MLLGFRRNITGCPLPPAYVANITKQVNNFLNQQVAYDAAAAAMSGGGGVERAAGDQGERVVPRSLELARAIAAYDIDTKHKRRRRYVRLNTFVFFILSQSLSRTS